MIAGFKKAATTSIYDYLGQHPQIYMSPIKETRYFLYDPNDPAEAASNLKQRPIRTLAEYKAQFAGAAGADAIGEATPSYVQSVQAAQRIQQLIPHAKLIFSMRNPIEQAYSGYWMRVRGGYEARSVEQAFREDLPKLRANSYYNLLKEWYALFDRDQIQVLLYENFKKTPVQEMQKLYQFLEVDATFAPNTTVKHNAGGVAKSGWRQTVVVWVRKYRYLRFHVPRGWRSQFSKFANENLAPPPAIQAEMKHLLQNLYSEDIQQLEDLVQQDCSSWGLQSEEKQLAYMNAFYNI